MLLNLGAGELWSHADKPWVNVDVRQEVLPDVRADVRALPFRTDSAAKVYAGHLLEHLPKFQVARALLEILRVLEPRGQFVAVGPDFERARYLHSQGAITDERLDADQVTLGGEGNPCLHQWNSTGVLVAMMVWQVGFVGTTELPIERAPAEFPVFDRGSKDQYAVVGWKGEGNGR